MWSHIPEERGKCFKGWVLFRGYLRLQCDTDSYFLPTYLFKLHIKNVIKVKIININMLDNYYVFITIVFGFLWVISNMRHFHCSSLWMKNKRVRS